MSFSCGGDIDSGCCTLLQSVLYTFELTSCIIRFPGNGSVCNTDTSQHQQGQPHYMQSAMCNSVI